LAETPKSSSDADSRARSLIIEAFEEARRRGNPDWRTMTVAVLKNRLLKITERSFREVDYGSRSISEFVKRYPDILVFDDSTAPPKVSLRAGSIGVPAPVPGDQNRIRPDLWSAIIDYRSGLTYVWDGLIARPVDTSSTVNEEDSTPALPTLTIEEFDDWRRQFIERTAELTSEDPVAIEQAGRWLENRLGTRYLPAALRAPWNRELKQLVVDRLVSWFREHGIAPPADLLQTRPAAPRQVVGADTLRQLVLRCVRVMTEDELRQLSLPPSAVLRAYGTAIPGRSSGGVDSE
jgi:hypothetical protein